MSFGGPAESYGERSRKEPIVSLPKVVSRDEWVAARRALLAKEKEFTRRRDELSAERRRLPMVRVDKAYLFEGPDGQKTLLDLFAGRRQLIVGHFMFDPRWEEGCGSCTAGADEIANGLLSHLHVRDTTFVYVSRAPIDRIEAYKARRGWTFPWYSSYGSDFNYDFHVTLDDAVLPLDYNFRTMAEHVAAGTAGGVEGEQPMERPGRSSFLRHGDQVFHTYSVYARGLETVGGSYYFLDETALGRQEDWEEPKDRAAAARRAVPDFSS
jgi:predicted dithiol-disulfide oxidoreductase (DUF899 family)